MKTETMTPRWVVENFLPDYDTRVRCVKDFDENNTMYLDEFYELHFPEALSQLLKAQREVCADNAKIQRVVVGHNGTNNEFGYMVDRESIINAPIPKPKNR